MLFPNRRWPGLLFAAVCALLVAAPARADQPKPNPTFRAQFAPEAPEGAIDTSSWKYFMEFSEDVTIPAMGKDSLMERKLLRANACTLGNPCTFRFMVLLMGNGSETARPTKLTLRYVIIRADGLRVEGYADADIPEVRKHYWVRQDRFWRMLDDLEAEEENTFVGGTWQLVLQNVRDQK